MDKSTVQGLATIAVVGVVGFVAGAYLYEMGATSTSSNATRDWTKPMSGVSNPVRSFFYNILAPLGVA
jgi:hypothetical protein